MHRWLRRSLMGLAVLAAARSAYGQASTHRARTATLDRVMRQFWQALAVGDSARARELSVGEQPLRVAYLFSPVTPAHVAQLQVRRTPPLRVRTDTAWRAYAMPIPEYWIASPYTARFEWRCGQWRIVALSTDAAAQ